MRRLQRGVTLIELLIVVVIVGILAAIAVPSYRQYVIRSQRVDAKEALLRLATAQEKFYLQNNTYATEDLRADDPPAGLGIAGTEHGWYTLTIVSANDTSFELSAEAVSTGPQAQDDDCQLFTVNSLGQRTAENADGGNSTDRCWR